MAIDTTTEIVVGEVNSDLVSDLPLNNKWFRMTAERVGSETWNISIVEFGTTTPRSFTGHLYVGGDISWWETTLNHQLESLKNLSKHCLGYTRYYMNSSDYTTDCNLMNIGDVGYTYGNTTTNSPGSGYVVMTTGSSENQKVQIGISTTGAGFKTRGYNSANGTWSAWV